MVHKSTILAGLALVLTAQAGPIAQLDAVEAPGVVLDGTTVDNADARTVIDGSVGVTDNAPLVEDGESGTDLTDPAVDGSTTVEVETPPTTTPDEDFAAVDLAAAAVQALPATCTLSETDPASWEASGGKKMLEEYLKANGPERWLSGLSRSVNSDRTPEIDCSSVDTNTCTVPTVSADCANYDFFFVRWMASRVNQSYKRYFREIMSGAIQGGFGIKKMVEDFKLPEPKNKNEEILKGVAFGTALASALLEVVPGASSVKKVAEGGVNFMGVSGAALGFAADNLPKPKTPDYDGFADTMEAYLIDMFTEGEKRLHETLAAIFGEGDDEESNKAILQDSLNRMSGMGVQDISLDAESLVFEMFKRGELLKVPDAVKSLEKSFDSIRHGILGNLLSSLQVFVEEREPEPKQGAQGCGALGTLEELGRCFVIMRRDVQDTTLPNQEGFKPLEDQFLRKMGEYNLDLHTLIRSVVACNNGELDKGKIVQGYPSCYFGLPFAINVAPNWHDKWTKRMDRCGSRYRNLDKMPKYIKNRGTLECQEKNIKEVPVWGPCKVSSKNVPSRDEAGQARYGIDIKTEGIDALGYCSYIHDLSHCPILSGPTNNKQCYRQGDGQNHIRFDVSLPHGPIVEEFNKCHRGLYKAFREDNFCDEYDA